MLMHAHTHIPVVTLKELQPWQKEPLRVSGKAKKELSKRPALQKRHIWYQLLKIMVLLGLEV
jgi:hypothetical protein